MGRETKTPWPRRTRGQGVFAGMGRGFWARRLPFYRNALESQADGNPVGQGVAVKPIHLYDLHLGVLRHGAGPAGESLPDHAQHGDLPRSVSMTAR